MSIKTAALGLVVALTAFASVPSNARADAPSADGGRTTASVRDTEVAPSMRCGCRRYYVRYRYYRPYVRYYRVVRYYRFRYYI